MTLCELLDTFSLGCLGGVAIYSFPDQGFNGPLFFVITLSVLDVMLINIIIIGVQPELYRLHKRL